MIASFGEFVVEWHHCCWDGGIFGDYCYQFVVITKGTENCRSGCQVFP